MDTQTNTASPESEGELMCHAVMATVQFFYKTSDDANAVEFASHPVNAIVPFRTPNLTPEDLQYLSQAAWQVFNGTVPELATRIQQVRPVLLHVFRMGVVPQSALLPQQG